MGRFIARSRIRKVRRIIFPLLLLILQTVAAFAQPTVSAEIASDPIPGQLFPRELTPATFNTPAVAMARDRRGVLIAWAMLGSDGYDRISVARLDATGHIAGAVRRIPVASPNLVEVTAPSVAADPGGQGFTIGWLEIPDTYPQSTIAVYCRLDEDLNPSVPSVLPILMAAPSFPPIVRSGKTTWFSLGKQVWQIRADGSAASPLDTGIAVSDMTVGTDFPQVVSSHVVLTRTTTCGQGPGCTGGGFFFGNCLCLITTFTNSYLLQFVSLYTLSAEQGFTFDSKAQPAIRSDGRDVMMAWFRGTDNAVVTARLPPSGFVDFTQATQQPNVVGRFAGNSGLTRPDIAGDGERYLVIWRTHVAGADHDDILGASIDRAGNVIPLSIATTTADAKDPSVIAVGPGQFLVAYEKLTATERRLAGRFVTFESRSHAVR